MQILVEDIIMELVTSTMCLVDSSVDDSEMGTGDEVDLKVVLSDGCVGSVGRLAGDGELLGRVPGVQMEAASPGAGVTVVAADGATLVSLVVEVFSDVIAGGSLVTPMGTSVGVLTVVILGTGAGPKGVVPVVMATGEVGKTGSSLLSVVAGSKVVLVDVDGTTTVVPVIGVAVGIPGVVKLEVAVEDLVGMVTLMVVSSGCTLVDRTFGVAVVVVLVVVAGVALTVDTTRVVTFSWYVVGLGRAMEVVGYCGDQWEGG